MSASDSVTPRLYAEALPISRAERDAASRGLFRGALQACEITADFFACAGGMALTFWLQNLVHRDDSFPDRMWQDAAVCVAIAFLSVLLLHRDGAYRSGGSLLHIRETEHALRGSVQSLLVLLPFAFFLGLQSAMSVFLMALVLVPSLLIAVRHAVTSVSRTAPLKRRTVIYSTGDAASRVLSVLSHTRGVNLHPVLVVDEDHSSEEQSIAHTGYRQRHFVPVCRGPITAALLQSCQCRTLVVALPYPTLASVDAALEAAKQAGANVAFLNNQELQKQPWTKTMDMDGFSLALLFEPCENLGYTATKRALDFAGSSLLLALLSPLFILIALLVKLDSSGPAIFSQERVGHRGKHFRMYKFRSMDTNAPAYDFSPVTPDDPRITRIGRLLRRTSLDELPQLANVFLGHMSLVGPRPEMPFITHGYTEVQRQRLQVIPGITGMWQLSTARAFPIHENLHYDFYYIRNRTFFMDIAILIHTLFFAMWGGI